KWVVRDGYFEVAPHTGAIVTKRGFGDVQLHIEWARPVPATGEGQDRGNSGVFMMTHYEIQVLDSYHSDTYADGQAAAVYGQTPPLVNASRPPGQWQTYDIIFHRPRFTADGAVRDSAGVTVLHNGVLVQDNTIITGWTVHGQRAHYAPHAHRRAGSRAGRRTPPSSRRPTTGDPTSCATRRRRAPAASPSPRGSSSPGAPQNPSTSTTTTGRATRRSSSSSPTHNGCGARTPAGTTGCSTAPVGERRKNWGATRRRRRSCTPSSPPMATGSRTCGKGTSTSSVWPTAASRVSPPAPTRCTPPA